MALRGLLNKLKKEAEEYTQRTPTQIDDKIFNTFKSAPVKIKSAVQSGAAGPGMQIASNAKSLAQKGLFGPGAQAFSQPQAFQSNINKAGQQIQSLGQKISQLQNPAVNSAKTVGQSYYNLGKGITTGVKKVFNPYIQQSVGVGKNFLAQPFINTASRIGQAPQPIQRAYQPIQNLYSDIGAKLSGSAIQNWQDAGVNPNNPTLRDVLKVGTNTVRAGTGAAGLMSGPATLGTAAVLGGGLNAIFGDKQQPLTQRVGEGVGISPLYAGFGKFGQSVTNPLLSKALPGIGGIASRLVGGVANVAEGKALDTATGEERIDGPLGSIALDFGGGFIGGVQAPNANQLEIAEDVLAKDADAFTIDLQKQLSKRGRDFFSRVFDVSKLKFNEFDLQNAGKKTIQEAEEEIRRGVFRPIVVAADGGILDGTHRIIAARNLGITKWPGAVIRNAGESLAPELSQSIKGLKMGIAGDNTKPKGAGGDLIQEAKKYKSAEEFVNRGVYDLPLKNKKLEFQNEVQASHNNQIDSIKFAHEGGNQKGYLEYVDYNGKPSISNIEVDPKYRRQGIAGDLIKSLQKEYPETKIDWGMTTDDGTALKKSLDSQLTDIWNKAQQPLGDVKALQGVETAKTLTPGSPSTPGGTGGGSPKAPQVIGLDTAGRPSSKYSFNINRKKLNLSKEAEQKLDDVVETMRPVLEGRRGKALTDEEIVRGGQKAVMLDEVMGREEAKQFAEKLQASRNFLKSQSEAKGLTPEYLAQLEIVSSNAADTARKLRSFAVDADGSGIKEAVLKDLSKLNIETDRLIKAAKNVDWSDAKQVTEFYRKFNPATLAKRLEEFRYTNMLSSPNTHLVNTFSNFLQSGLVTPIEKTITGGLDWAKSALTGSERQYYASQGVDYAKGFWKSLPEAFTNFKNTIAGTSGLMKPDIEFLPTGTGKLHQLYTTPLRLLEASDQFFKAMVKGGELASLETAGIKGAEATKLAEQSSDYRLFRQAFDPDGKLGQGGFLKLWDKWNSGIANLRRLPGGRWLVPFLQTPTNILKQGVEYSPLGVATIPGSREPLVQLSKTIIGTSVFTGAYALASSGLTTWDAPTKTKDRERFYAAGLQPYSVKIGDKWVSYSKLGPLSYPIAMAAAMKWAKDNGAEDDKLATAGAGLGGVLQFFADQSYVQGIGDVIDAVRGDEFKQGRALANIPSQLIPYRALQGWIARLVDPIYRKTTGGTVIQQAGKSVLSQIPIASKGLEPYTTPTGEPSQRSMPLLNAVSPVKVSQQRFSYDQPVAKISSGGLTYKNPLEVSAAGELPTNNNDFKVLYEDAQKTIGGYKDLSAKIRTGLKDNQTLEEAQAELLEAENLVKRMEAEQPEMVYNIGLDTYASGEGMSVEERAKWAAEWLGKAKDKKQYNSWYQEMLDKKVITKDVAELLQEAGLGDGKYNSGGKIKSLGGGSGKKYPKITIGKTVVPKIKVPNLQSSLGSVGKLQLTPSPVQGNLKITNAKDIQDYRNKLRRVSLRAPKLTVNFR